MSAFIDVLAARRAPREADGALAAEGALLALRPVVGASSPEELQGIARGFSAALGARHHALAIVERGESGHAVRWLCEDAAGWWEDLRPEYRRLLAGPVGLEGRTARYAMDEATPAPVRALLRQRNGHGLVVAMAGTREPGSLAACLSLMFGWDTAGRAQQRTVAAMCHHAAALLLDAYLALPAARADLPRLSAREAECLHWAAVGKTSWETACILGVAERTVNFHLGNVFTKLKVNNKQAAVARAISQGLLTV